MESRSYVSTAVLPKPKRKTWKYIAYSLLAVAILGGSWLGFSYDWDSSQPAAAPETQQVVSDGPAKALRLEIQNTNILESDLVVTAAQWVDVFGELDAKINDWQWSPLSRRAQIKTAEEMAAYVEKHKHLPVMQLRFQLRCRSPKSPGFIIAFESAVQEHPRGNSNVSFKGPLWIPRRAGMYEFCMILNKKTSDRRLPAEDPTDYVIVSKHITVLPAAEEK